VGDRSPLASVDLSKTLIAAQVYFKQNRAIQFFSPRLLLGVTLGSKQVHSHDRRIHHEATL
jgi:hypothetical protein